MWSVSKWSDLDEIHEVEHYVSTLSEGAFDRYANPFEQKWTLRDKFEHEPVHRLLQAMEAYGLADGLVPDGPPLWRDIERHYAGVFRYDEGDHLSVHCDAGVFPRNPTLRKRTTALLYLTGGAQLEFWRGDPCTDDAPAVRELAGVVYPEPGTFVLFTNHDDAWHGVPEQLFPDASRVVATVSFLTPTAWDDEGDESFTNKRQRAYFVPRPGEHWDAEKLALRDKRADPERYAEVYRT